MKKLLQNANPMRTPERVLTGVGWSLALIFGYLLSQQDRSFEEVALTEPAPFSVEVREKAPEGQAKTDLTTLDRQVYPAMDRARRRLRQRDPHRALAEISFAWTVCRSQEVEAPAELHSLFADAMAEMVRESRRSERRQATVTAPLPPSGPPPTVGTRVVAPKVAVSRPQRVRDASAEWVPGDDYPKAKKTVKPPRRDEYNSPPPPPPPVANYSPPQKPGPPGMPRGQANRGPGMGWPPGPPAGGQAGPRRPRSSSYPGPRGSGFPGPPPGYEPSTSPPGY